VLEAIDGVVDRIRHEVRLPAQFDYTHLKESQTPTPNPSPQGEGELSPD
jgi:hypothetical protein